MAVQEMPISKIKMSRNSRLDMKSEDLAELMSSIKETGLLQPIGVVKVGKKDEYEVCFGNRRFLAMSKLGRKHIPVIIQEAKTKSDVDLKNLTENIQRRNISLTEVGRYIELLQRDGNMNLTEIAVRLGVSKNYVVSCLEAFKKVPEEYRNDLEVRTPGKRKSTGKIPIAVANKIANAGRTYNLTRTETKLLFAAAKREDGFMPENLARYAMAIKSGKKDFVNEVPPLRQLSVRFVIEENEYRKLEKEYVTDGPFNSVSSLITAIVAGEKAVRVKLAKRPALHKA